MLLRVILFLGLLNFKSIAQCPPANPTLIITGLYTLSINPSPGSIVYISPSATVTGNINLYNCSLYNCGTIFSKKIKMQQSLWNNQYILANNNIINCDSILLDTLGHLHNNDTLICKQFKMKFNANASNINVMNVNKIFIELKSYFDSEGSISANYFELKDTYSTFVNYYGNVFIGKLFKVDIGSVVYNTNFICVDSCFRNEGFINGQSAQSWTPTIKVGGLSQNTGTIVNHDFCDVTTSNGGMPDINTGTLNAVTFCTSLVKSCPFTLLGIEEYEIKSKMFLVFPNPATNYLNIHFDHNTPNAIEIEHSKIEIINYLGETVLQLSYSNNINVSMLSQGFYTLKITTSKRETYYSNFIKQ